MRHYVPVMLKTLLSGLLVAVICSFVNASPTTQPSTNSSDSETSATDSTEPSLEDPAARSQRSANLSHVTGTARKIQMFIKNRHLQILPDGTVNGTTDDNSAYTILQRTTVGIGQMKIQGVATCQYLCMASCGLLYGSKEFSDECVFNETITQSNYNTYSSKKYSNKKRTFFLALNRRGQSRKLVIRVHHPAGKLASYIRVLTRNVSPEMLPSMRHHNHACTAGAAADQNQKHRPGLQRCPKRRKRKKKRRKCANAAGDGSDLEMCPKKQKAHKRQTNVSKCDDDDNSDSCQDNSMQ